MGGSSGVSGRGLDPWSGLGRCGLMELLPLSGGRMTPLQRQRAGQRRLGPHPTPTPPPPPRAPRRVCVRHPGGGQLSTIQQDQPGSPAEAGWLPAPLLPLPAFPVWPSCASLGTDLFSSPGATQSTEKVWFVLSRVRPGFAPRCSCGRASPAPGGLCMSPARATSSLGLSFPFD